VDAVVANSKQIIEQGSKSFAAASKLFDPKTREKAFMLYAWCRYCDDEIDGQALGHGQRAPTSESQLETLDRLILQTNAAMDGVPQTHPVFEAFQRVFRECGIPREYPAELLEGFAMDVQGHVYRTIDDTLLYSYRVAGVVGAMMAYIMGVDDRKTLDRAIDLGLAFQLTNICRDVMEDAENGRVYLPRDWLDEAGAPNDPKAFPGAERQLIAVVERVLSEADRYYASSELGIAQLPFRSAWAIGAARSIYGAIGEVVRKRGANAWRERSRTTALSKLGLLIGSGWFAARIALKDNEALPARSGLWSPPGG
jgi:phytoene synthase